MLFGDSLSGEAFCHAGRGLASEGRERVEAEGEGLFTWIWGFATEAVDEAKGYYRRDVG